MNAGEICNRDVVIINRDNTILEAAKLMREYHVGDVVVVEERQGVQSPVGILTDRDIVIEILGQDLEPAEVQVGDAMSFELLTATEEDEILETVKRMRSKGVRRIPVVNQRGSLEGIITVDDLVDLLAEQIADLAALITTEQRQERRNRE
ncbi:MAG: CBS domain-containing protein [Desulfobulbaceae bacterium]|nr:CBS domain-containing protein [Desulfobulbaceae bacterium]MCK5340234.1 CBS domain-containing protein [Desulfobulbaceae bacterium]